MGIINLLLRLRNHRLRQQLAAKQQMQEQAEKQNALLERQRQIYSQQADNALANMQRALGNSDTTDWNYR